MQTNKLIGATPLAVVASGCATTGSSQSSSNGGDGCLFSRQINDRDAIDNDRIHVEGIADDRFF